MIKGYYVSGNTMVQELSERLCVKAVPILSASGGLVYINKNVIPEGTIVCFVMSMWFDGKLEMVVSFEYDPVNGTLSHYDDLDGVPTNVYVLYMK